MLNQVAFRACSVLLPDLEKPMEQRKSPAGFTNKPFTHTVEGKTVFKSYPP